MYSQATNVEQEIMKKYAKCSQATNVEQEIMKKYTKCTFKVQMLNGKYYKKKIHKMYRQTVECE